MSRSGWGNIQGFKVWKRRSFHQCASELEQVSERFRKAELNIGFDDEASRLEELEKTSISGVEILRILALAVRNEQDYGHVPYGSDQVGSLSSDVTPNFYQEVISSYRPPCFPRSGFEALSLREALNKVAHLDLSKAGYYADLDDHDLILAGTYRGRNWVAILSVPKLCSEIKGLPDQPITSSGDGCGLA